MTEIRESRLQRIVRRYHAAELRGLIGIVDPRATAGTSASVAFWWSAWARALDAAIMEVMP